MYGSSPHNVVVLHGGPGASGEVAPIAVELQDQFGILEPLPKGSTIDEQVSEIAEMIRKLCEPPVYMIGHSWGAILALMFAAEHPELVRKLILISCGPLEEGWDEEIIETRFSRLYDRNVKEIILLVDIISEKKPGNRQAAYELLQEKLIETDAYAPIPQGKNRIGCDLDAHKTLWGEALEMRESGALADIVGMVECPVFAIHGEYDPNPHQSSSNLISATVDDFTVEVLNRCGHRPWIEEHAHRHFYALLRKALA